MSDSQNGPIVISGASSIPLTGGSIGRMDFNKTGSWKVVEPYYEDLTPPCDANCLCGSDVIRWVSRVADGRIRDALDILREANPFPAICGRVCPHPCESKCSRIEHGGAIGVHNIERYVGDYGIAEGSAVRPRAQRKEKIAVVGSGPAGLSCAFYLGRQGFQVTVYEMLSKPGGLLRTGIPTFRLPREVLDAELQIFRDLPVTFETGRKLGENLKREDLDAFDAVFLGVGRQATRKAGIPGEDLPGVLDGIHFLRDLEEGKGVDCRGKVIVIGGGNTALDCARSALRLGARATIAYRRTEPEMPAFEDEISEGREEGVEIILQVMPKTILEKEGRVGGIQLLRTRQGEQDSSGRRKAVPVEGSEFEIEADTIIMALGETIDKGPIEGLLPPKERIFAGGDLIDGGTVSAAIGEGRRAAAAIEERLAGSTSIATDLAAARGARAEVVPPERMNPAYIRYADAIGPRIASPSERRECFREITGALDSVQAIGEAQRCLSCGTCVSCDNCLIFCPDRSIVRDGAGYRVLYDYCKGCGVCSEECPRAAIHIRKVALG